MTPECETCGGDGIVITWVHRECGGVDLDPETHRLCPDCTEIYGPVPPWADYPECPNCDGGFGCLIDDGSLECVGCAHTWRPTDDERVQAERAQAAGQVLDLVHHDDDFEWVLDAAKAVDFTAAEAEAVVRVFGDPTGGRR